MASAPEPPSGPSGRSLSALLKELLASVGELLRKEGELARVEMVEGLHEAQRAGRWFALALVPAAVGLVLIALAIAYGLAAYMPMWLAALIPGVVSLAAAGALALAGKRRASRIKGKLTPELAARSLREDKQFLGEQLSQLKSSVTGGT